MNYFTKTIVISVFLVFFSLKGHAQIYHLGNTLGSTSSALGRDNTSDGPYSFAVGRGNQAKGYYSMAQGYYSQAFGSFSASLGVFSDANGYVSYAIGNRAKATGNFTVSIGNYSTASGYNSFAIGDYISTAGYGSYALGRGVNASNPLDNYLTNSLMVGFNSNVPTLFVGSSSGMGTYGKVGIGNITNPLTTLDVNGKITMRLGAATNFVAVSDANGTMTWTDPASLGIGGLWQNNSPHLYFNSGFVGIGTTTPQGKLQIQGGSGEQTQGQIHLVGNGGAGPGDAYISFYEGAEAGSKWSVGVKDNGNAFSISHGLTMDAAPKLIIAEATGNVGIGTTTPQDKLQVGNTSSKLVVGSADGVGLGYGTSYIGFNAARQSQTWSTSTDNYHNAGAIIYGGIYDGLSFSTIPNNGGTTDQTGITDETVKNNTRLHITSYGNIGIGTRAPSAKLDVKGNLKISTDFTQGIKAIAVVDDVSGLDVCRVMSDGHIYATELTIKLKEEFPDYVFAKNYELMPLKELSSYLSTNHHLPNVPSAEHVASEGLSVGTMQVKQMEKIEELTLYILELNKRIEQLEAEKNRLNK